MTTVLHVQGAAERGGAERILLSLADHGRHHGIKSIIGMYAEGPFAAELREHGHEVLTIGEAPRTRALWRLRPASRTLAAVARDVDADIVQGNGERMGVLAAMAGHAASLPSVVWLHDAPLRSASAVGVEVLLRMARPTAFVAGSAWLGRAFERSLLSRVAVIRHGIDLDELPEEPADLRRELGWPDDAVVVAHVARLQRWKGADVFIRAVAIAARRVPEARFAVVGGSLYGWEQEFGESLSRLAAQLGLEDSLAFLGHRDDALAVMAACDVVVHSSLRPEPLGLVVPEAMAMGRAVVASRTRGPEEVIDDGQTGLLVQPGDEAALADAIMALVRDPAGRIRLGEAAASAVHARWSGPSMAAEFATLYTQLLGSPARP